MKGVTPLPKRCDGCGTAWRTLFDVFVNGLGWQRRCAGCAHLSVVPGDAA